jgi:isoleucyl-tRNA synthetase
VWAIRSEVTKALETARVAGTIGHSLDARVRLTASGADHDVLSRVGASELEAVFIVSQVELVRGDATAIVVTAPEGAKCGRCWNYRPTVGASSEHPQLCGPCVAVVTSS